ncbi:CLUMA_CG003738, isoform A [Clunio marinus]|uniref:CLUMA_CG003738, isoform A n=1 Tax=Clunio marinus TaxID=568069 RepID=A0A1J1HPW8_9DIPT|nr:CLUMA_CG003738, isoform A [Clunio marinus]
MGLNDRMNESTKMCYLNERWNGSFETILEAIFSSYNLTQSKVSVKRKYNEETENEMSELMMPVSNKY